MGQKLVVGPINKGLRDDVTAFNIDNDSFPRLENSYQWRGRAKRKRGTSLLGRLQRSLSSQSLGNTSGGGLLSVTILSTLSLQTNSALVPGGISDATKAALSLQVTISPQFYIDSGANTFLPGKLITGATQANPCSITSNSHGLSTGNQVYILNISGMTQLNNRTFTITNTGANTFTLDGVDSSAYTAYSSGGAWVITSPATTTGSIDYATTAISIQTAPVLAATAATASLNYYPNLPVMGLEELTLDTTANTQQLGFDTVYAYNIPIAYPYTPYSVSFYKNTSTPVSKQASTPLIWNGQDYQQFWTTNYQGALWATNGIRNPSPTTSIGMQYKLISSATAVGAPATDVDFVTTNNHPFVAGDWVFINETNTLTGMNFQTGYVLAAPAPAATTFRARFPGATIAAGPANTGIIQALTTSCQPDVSSTTPTNTKDCIRWYDGDPTTASAPYPATAGKGWVNFCPPLISVSGGTFSISDLPTGIYYLVGARMIIPYKDRLLFLGPVVQKSSVNSQVYLPDTIIYSQNGTPYYTASFNGSPSSTQSYTEQLVPDNQTAQPSAFWEDVVGYGGFIQAGIQSPITTAGFNEDVLIVGFKKRQTRLIYSGNDIVPFNFYSINTELGSESTFSSVVLDRGVISIGGRGIIITSQVGSQRIDLEIPDDVFQFKLGSNGSERICAQRDYIKEWIYFTYRGNESDATYPNETLLYNYRDKSWAIFKETYTTYGTFRRQTGLTWATIYTKFPTWSSWNEPWSAGDSTLLQPQTIGGNAQGFVMFLAEGTDEATSGYIKTISTSLITSPGHGLNVGDFIYISGCTGTISAQVNGNIFEVSAPLTQDTFTVSPGLTSATYTGLGVFKRIYRPLIQTKQFPVAWEMARKTRIGPQQYLFSTTEDSEITLEIYLSQNAAQARNDSLVDNKSLVYTDILYTCPESDNLGLTAANTNLQMPSAAAQQQIWHRMNTSLLGDTVQIGFTLSDAQLKAQSTWGDAFAITGATQANPCVLTCAGGFDAGTMIKITGISGMVELNFNAEANHYHYVLSSTSTTVTIDVNSTSFGSYSSGGTAQNVWLKDQFAEIELHSMILDVSPSQVIA